jgi:ABC-2 type transport system ATP-binding protein
MTPQPDRDRKGKSSEAATTFPPVLIANDLRKTYGSREAIRGLSFSLQSGRVLGLLGPNGAGKTTTIRVLTTILKPSSGEFFVDGTGSEHAEQIRRKIGVLPEGQGFPKGVTAIEYLTYFGELYGRPAAEARKVGLEQLSELGLQNRTDSAIGTFSHGMRQRLGIARALINNPRVVFLDEPTLGLDPRGQQELLDIIRQIARQRNAGVILSSHLLSEMESVCDDVVIMNAGAIVASGTLAEVMGRAPQNGALQNAVRVRVRVPPESVSQAQQILKKLPAVEQASSTDKSSGWLTVVLTENGKGAASPDGLGKNKILEALIDANIPIAGFETEGNRLQDVFLELTSKAIQ